MSRSEPFTIASVAKTLVELKKLPLQDQAMALLRRIAQIFPQNRISDGPHKANLLLPNDPYSLAAGFDLSENMPVRLYLLGRPWNWLVNEGYLIDPGGNGFYSISDEGLEAIEGSKSEPVIAASLASPVSKLPNQSPPTAFISYSWDSKDHRKWVLDLATRLQGEHGVKIILDQWGLYPGVDKELFMEQSIATADFVLVVCTREYARKSDSRAGGVGYEAMMLTSQLAKQISQRKFIPVLRSGDWNTSIPIWIQSKLGVDLSGVPYDEKQYGLLLRVLHKALEEGPKLAPKPTLFASEQLRNLKTEDNAVTALLPPAKRARKLKTSGTKRKGPTNKTKPVLVAEFQEENGEIVKIEEEEDDLPSISMDLWIENAPAQTALVYFEITDKGVEGRKWSQRRSKGPRAFLADDLNSWGDLEIWARGTLSDSTEWTTKSGLYEALRRHYGTGRQRPEIQEALEQIRDN
jgi:hypothetical protein